MIVCDGNYGLGIYGMDLVHNWKPERSRVYHLVQYKIHHELGPHDWQ